MKLSRLRLFGSNTPINTSCCCNKPVVLPIFYSKYTAITISCFDLLPFLQSFICLKLSEWMSRDIYLRERKAWSPELCPICPVIWWRDAHWATAVNTSWSEAWRITWHCWYCALWVHLAVNSNIAKHLRKIRTKANRTQSRSLNWFGFGRFKINSHSHKEKRFFKEVLFGTRCENYASYLLFQSFILILSLMWQLGQTQPKFAWLGIVVQNTAICVGGVRVSPSDISISAV